jgi:hypothetical protein
MTTGYEEFQALVKCLQDQGLSEPVVRLDSLLKTAWTTSSEMLGEPGQEIRRIEKTHKNVLTPESQKAMKACLGLAGRVW